MPANGKSNGRFELPQLTPVNFSLTDGTDIPPPLPDSPIEEKPPPPAPQAQVKPVITTTVAANGRAVTPTKTNGNGVIDGRGRTSGTDAPPLSPASTTKPSSIRRFLSRKSLNQNFVDGTNHNGASQEDLTGILRPDSPSSFSTKSRPSVAGKKSNSWFRRFSSNNAVNRSKQVVEQPRTEPRRGPPPPKLPELNQLKAQIPEDDEGSLGGEDMFKNIK